MKTKQDAMRQAEPVRADELVTAVAPAITTEPADVAVTDEFAGHGGSYVFHPAIGLRTRAVADADAAVEVAQ